MFNIKCAGFCSFCQYHTIQLHVYCHNLERWCAYVSRVYNLFPPTGSPVQFGLSISGQCMITVLPYVMCLRRSSGILAYLMKTMMLVLFVPGTSWASHPSSLVYDLPHSLVYFGLQSKCHISMSVLVSLLSTALSTLVGNIYCSSGLGESGG